MDPTRFIKTGHITVGDDQFEASSSKKDISNPKEIKIESEGKDSSIVFVSLESFFKIEECLRERNIDMPSLDGKNVKFVVGDENTSKVVLDSRKTGLISRINKSESREISAPRIEYTSREEEIKRAENANHQLKELDKNLRSPKHLYLKPVFINDFIAKNHEILNSSQGIQEKFLTIAFPDSVKGDAEFMRCINSPESFFSTYTDPVSEHDKKGVISFLQGLQKKYI